MKESDNKNLLFGIGKPNRHLLPVVDTCIHSHSREAVLFLVYLKKSSPNRRRRDRNSQYQKVYFIDAHTEEFDKGYFWKEIHPKATHSFSSHELDPETVLYLTETIYNCTPEAYVLGISGENFDLHIGLSEKAIANLSAALDFFRERFCKGENA